MHRTATTRRRTARASRRATLLAAATLSAIGLLGGSTVLAASYFSGPYATTSCPIGYGCVQGSLWTQGYNYAATENHWSAVGHGNGETEPSDQIRNRNSTSKRQVMVRVWRNSRWECNVLNYDNRGWVNTSSWADDAPSMKGAGDTIGCTINYFL